MCTCITEIKANIDLMCTVPVVDFEDPILVNDVLSIYSRKTNDDDSITNSIRLNNARNILQNI